MGIRFTSLEEQNEYDRLSDEVIAEIQRAINTEILATLTIIPKYTDVHRIKGKK